MEKLGLIWLATAILQWQIADAKLSSSSDDGSGSGQCGKVEVDCSTHKIKIGGGQEKTINCGKNGTTKSGTGKVGGKHSGPIVKDGVRIEGIAGMGDSGGGRVFHLPFGGSQPTGSDSTKGCIAVDRETLTKLKSCKGATLSIKGNGGAGTQLADSSGGGRSPASGRSGGRRRAAR